MTPISTLPKKALVLALATTFASGPAAAGSFRLNTGTFTVPISYDGNPVNAEKLLGSIPTTTTLITSLSAYNAAVPSSPNAATTKTAALAMALGRCIFLQVSDLETDLKGTTAPSGVDKTALAAKVSEAMGVNEWLATAVQESKLTFALHSGYFQIDNDPTVLYGNATGSPTVRKATKYAFLQNLKGGAGVDLNGTTATGAYLNYMNLQGFVWGAVEKGYYDALSYNINKAPYAGVPSATFTMAQWAMNYAGTAANATHYPLTSTQLSGVNLDPAIGFVQTMGLIYNRGQYPFVRTDVWPGLALDPILAANGAMTFQSSGSFTWQVPTASSSPDVWGAAYVWQLGWLVQVLNGTGTFYSETISAADVNAMLALLKGMYNGGNTGAADAIVDAATTQVNALTWGAAYNSSTTYDNMYKVATAILNKQN